MDQLQRFTHRLRFLDRRGMDAMREGLKLSQWRRQLFVQLAARIGITEVEDYSIVFKEAVDMATKAERPREELRRLREKPERYRPVQRYDVYSPPKFE